jgi:hypothetical protein
VSEPIVIESSDIAALSQALKPSSAEHHVSDLSSAVGAGGELSATDKKLISYAKQNRTPQEMADALGFGFTATRCLTRLREILRSHDYLSQTERKALLLMDMQELRDILMDHVRNEGGEVHNERTGETYYSFGDPRWSANLVKLLSEMNKTISADKGELDVQRVKLRRRHAAIMLKAIDLVFRLVVRKMVEAGLEVDSGLLLSLLEECLPAAIAYVEQETEDDL